jgi:hypothetical protein
MDHVHRERRGYVTAPERGCSLVPYLQADRMTVLACVFGACIICSDVVVRQFPGMKSFRIQDSNTFLACSLSLSFGVMVGQRIIRPRLLLVSPNVINPPRHSPLCLGCCPHHSAIFLRVAWASRGRAS